MKKLFLLIAFNAWIALLATGQNVNPVKWTFEAKSISDKEFDLTFTAQIDPGWYVYSQKLPDDGPIPTSIAINNTEGIELVGEAKEEGHQKAGFDDMFGMYITKYSESMKITQRIKVTGGTKEITGALTYMTCDNNRCLPPKDVLFSLELD